MIFGHEGQPRSGKSYEAVLYHILPALKAGRHVYFRLNGVDENADKIAAHLGMSEVEVRALLHPMGNQEVHDWLVCDSENDGALTFPHLPQQALVVVDEAHEFWPVGRAALPDRVANFFAKHGHISLDVVLISQDVKELHRSIIRRMAKKNFYAKLDAVGMDQAYSVRFYSSPLAGKFELIGSEKRKYDPLVWTFYHGIQPGVEGNEVYKVGSKTLWQAARKPAIAMAVALALGLFFIARFFTGGGLADAGQPKPKPVAQAVVPAAPASAIPAAVAQAVPMKKAPEYPPGIGYLLELAKDARPRYAGSFEHRHLIEFRGAQGHVVERLTSDQVVGLGWSFEATVYGAVLRYEDAEQTFSETLIFTAWPVDLPGEQSERTTRAIAAAGPVVLSASETPPASAAIVAASSPSGPLVPQIAAYGGFRE